MSLRDYLHFKRLKVKDFSEILKCSTTHISGIINGKRKPSLWLAKAIQEATQGEVSVEELMK